MPLLPILILAWPLIEIAGFVVVGSHIGVLATIGLVLATTVLGAALLRVQGFGALARIQEASARGQSPARDLVHGAMIMLAGILLVLPGFVSDILGLLLFIPAIRELGWRLVKDRIVAVDLGGGGFSAGFGGTRRGGRTIDLDASDYSASDRDGPSGPSIDHRD